MGPFLWVDENFLKLAGHVWCFDHVLYEMCSLVDYNFRFATVMEKPWILWNFEIVWNFWKIMEF